MDYCAKRWQTREGTYQLKRRRLLPDVRDPPEQGDEEVDMTDLILHMDAKVDILQGGRDEMRGLGARFVSPFLHGFSPALL